MICSFFSKAADILSIKNCDFTLVGFGLFKVMLGITQLKNTEVHLEDNSHIECSEILNHFGKDTLIQEKGIKLFIRKRELNDRTAKALMEFKEVELV